MHFHLKRVLISDPVHEKCAELLLKYGVNVCTKYKLSTEELIQELKNHDGLIVRSETKVTAEVIEASPSIKLVGRAGSGVDTIDVAAATRNGVVVLNTPGGNSLSACELTCSLILALARNVVQAGISLKDKRWDRKIFAGTELNDKVLGIVGFGNIGRLVAYRMQSFGMKILAYDPFLTPEIAKETNVTQAQLSDIWMSSDYITVHTPLIPQTKNLINAETLAKCKKGVRIINVARGGIVDEHALLDSIKEGHCGGAAIDVFVDEPPKNHVTWELIQHPKVICTPHLGASTSEAQQRVAVEIAEQFLAISGIAPDCAVTGVVNAPCLTATLSKKNHPWFDLSEKLGQVASRFHMKHLEKNVEITTMGNLLKAMKFIYDAIVLGILSKDNKEKELNLVNVRHVADNNGLHIKMNHVDDSENAIIVKVGNHVIKGTLVEDKAVLLSINDSEIKDGLMLNGFVSMYEYDRQEDIEKIIKNISIRVSNFDSFHIIKEWVILQTPHEVFITVPGLNSY